MGESMVKTSFYGNLHVEELTVLKSKRIHMSKGMSKRVT